MLSFNTLSSDNVQSKALVGSWSYIWKQVALMLILLIIFIERLVFKRFVFYILTVLLIRFLEFALIANLL